MFFALCVATLTGCSRGSDPFSYVKVSGTVSYEDGSRIPASSLVLNFISEMPSDAKVRPKVGMCYVDAETGKFDAVTTHKANDGVVVGKHKVTITDQGHKPLPANIIPAIYSDSVKTPLEVDTDNLPFEIKVKKP